MPVVNKNVGEKIDELLSEKGWSQHRLAEESGVDQPTINNIIHGGDPKASTVRKLADALKVSADKII